MKFYIGVHEHKHGETVYLFQSDAMSEQDFIDHLGLEFEPKKGEFTSLTEETPIQFPEVFT
jgi:hypothetical protein